MGVGRTIIWRAKHSTFPCAAYWHNLGNGTCRLRSKKQRCCYRPGVRELSLDVRPCLVRRNLNSVLHLPALGPLVAHALGTRSLVNSAIAANRGASLAPI